MQAFLWDALKDNLNEQLQHLKVGCRHKKTFETISLYVKGLLSPVKRKNSWQIAEHIGASTPYNFQYMLYCANVNEEALQKKLMNVAISTFGQDGVLTFDDTGFLKKGEQSAGVQRQYTGTAGRVENCQIGTFMGYKTDRGHMLLDAKLYLPQVWIDDRERCQKAGIPTAVVFEKKALQAANMFKSFKKEGYVCSWVTADEAYGKDPDFVKTLEDYKQPYVLAVPKDYHIRCGELKQKLPSARWTEKADDLSWKRLSAGLGSKGERLYDWYLNKRSEILTPEGYERFLLVRRSIATNEMAYYSVFAPLDTSIESIVSAAGSRWSIEECFEMAKGEAGLDQYEVRSYQGWKRHIILSMWGIFILASLKQQMNDKERVLLSVEQAGQELDDKVDMSSQAGMLDYKKKQKILSDLRYKKLHDL